MKKYFNIKLNINREIAIITIISTLLIIIDQYHNFTGTKAFDRFFIFLLIPILVILISGKKPLKDYGFQLGDWKAGLAITAVSILIMAPILWFITKSDPEMIDYYSSRYSSSMIGLVFLDLIGWEFLFRGWILFGYAEEFGDNALWIQAVPFAIAHIGKPEIETLSTIFGGFLFGLIAWKTKSFLYPFLIHLFINVFTILIAAKVFG
jgi:membrane protease YdiL (CAAX protease family)